MNEPFETNDRRMPYELSEAAFEALHARIGRRLDAADAERRGAQFADEFPAFGDEKPLVGAGAFVRQRADESDVGFGQHLKGRFSIVKVRPSSARSLAGKSVRASSSSGASSL